MALINIPTDHIKLRKTLSMEKKPLMLKDYLRDDLSSCSSSGFKSFPRRQCCTTVRFLLEADRKKSKDYSSTTKRLLKRSGSKPASTTISALQRASAAVLNAVKLLPFPSIKSSSPSLRSNSSMREHSRRSFSRKLFKRSFWRKADKEDGEIKRWRLFPEFLEENNQPSDQNTIVTKVNTTDTSSTNITTSRVSTSTSSNSWAESEFTADSLQSSGGNSESSIRNDTVENETNLLEKEKVSNIVGVTVDEDSIKYTKEQDWRSQEGKEQFSPVSVLDCPFHDEEEEDNNSPFQDQLSRVEGKKQKLMQKIRRFESLAQLGPVDLEKRIALAELEDESIESPREALCSVSVNANGNNSDHDQDKQVKDREASEKLLKQSKSKIPSNSFKFDVDNLMIDLINERLMVEENAKQLAGMGLEVLGIDLLKVAEDWVNGNAKELVIGWEEKEGRAAYVKEMERNENWRNFNEEKEEVGSAVELEVFCLLVEELLTDFF